MSIHRALLSVADKTGLDSFVQKVSAQIPTMEWIATQGTQQFLSSCVPEIAVRNVSEFVQVLPGQNLVKTLDSRLFSGILLDDPPSEVPKIDVVVSIPYPFSQQVTPETALTEAIALIDIGGIALLRAAAKNHRRVLAISTPDQYSLVIQELSRTKEISMQTRQQMAIRVFEQCSQYNAHIADYLGAVYE